MIVKFSFPWSLYFQQLFAADTYVRLINPFNFWYKYRIKHLERCSELDLIGHLERCSQKKYRQAKTRNCKVEPKYRVYADKLNSLEPIQKQIFVVQSSENLKYRGTEYQKPKIVGIYFDRITLNSNLEEPDYPLTSDL